jgi:hypothetical protein
MTARHNIQSQSDSLQQNYVAALRFVLLPLVVLLLADFIFSLVASDIAKLVAELKQMIESEPIDINSFVEARLRLNWGTTVFLFYITLIAVSIFNISTIRQSLSGKKSWFLLQFGLL